MITLFLLLAFALFTAALCFMKYRYAFQSGSKIGKAVFWLDQHFNAIAIVFFIVAFIVAWIE